MHFLQVGRRAICGGRHIPCGLPEKVYSNPCFSLFLQPLCLQRWRVRMRVRWRRSPNIDHQFTRLRLEDTAFDQRFYLVGALLK